jgi:hypothetical protein
MKKLVTMREALARPDLLGDALPGESWRCWRILLIAIVGEELTPDEREVFAKLTGGRQVEPGCMVELFLVVAGRRSGKTKANPSLSRVEPVSVCTANSCREKVWRGQRPRRDFWRLLCIPRRRGRLLSRFPRQGPGKLKTISTAPGNRICAGLGGGLGRTRTSNQVVMNAPCLRPILAGLL